MSIVSEDYTLYNGVRIPKIAILIFPISGCKKDKSSSDTTVNSNLPVLTTSSVGSITPTTASSGGSQVPE